ncbi:unnamed protein product [Rotaria sordida]|uniref:Uncharacterized protein n=1 Tax=Rotaria sordida TaxID=392033 RepID=A0A815T4V9_9BILA|nr:unnamed protein product [Rotaria sordida]CAF1654734.1 unnamed protein product [Rotaria sordida]
MISLSTTLSIIFQHSVTIIQLNKTFYYFTKSLSTTLRLRQTTRPREPPPSVLKTSATTTTITTGHVVKKQSKLKNYLHYIGNWFGEIWNDEGVRAACFGLFLIVLGICAIGGAFYLIALFGPQGRKPMGF